MSQDILKRTMQRWSNRQGNGKDTRWRWCRLNASRLLNCALCWTSGGFLQHLQGITVRSYRWLTLLPSCTCHFYRNRNFSSGSAFRDLMEKKTSSIVFCVRHIRLVLFCVTFLRIRKCHENPRFRFASISKQKSQSAGSKLTTFFMLAAKK